MHSETNLHARSILGGSLRNNIIKGVKVAKSGKGRS
jgi:hypothetical protein